MKVVLVTDYAWVSGGPSRVAIDLAQLLDSRGLEVRFFAGVGPIDTRLAHLKVSCLEESDLLHGRRSPKTMLKGLWNRRAALGFARFVEGIDPAEAVVHVHQFQKCLSGSVVREAKRMGFKVLYHCHDYFLACPNGGYFNHVSQRPCHLRPLSMRCLLSNCDKRSVAHKQWRYLRSVIERIAGVADSVDRIAAVSPQAAEMIAAFLPDLVGRIDVLGNPVNVPAHPPDPNAQRRYALLVGRLEPEKGVLDAAEACRHAQVPLVAVGDGPLASRLRARGVKVAGWVGVDEVSRWMSEASCLLFPSRYHEPQGLVVMEALAHGLPVIASDITGAAAYIENGCNGYLLPPGDVERWAMKVAEVHGDPDLRRRLAERALESVSANALDHESYLERLLAVYRSTRGEL